MMGELGLETEFRHQRSIIYACCENSIKPQRVAPVSFWVGEPVEV